MTEPLPDATPGRPDDCFAHDGLITKRAVRAMALAHLRPAPGELLWDIGLGSGAVSIEWCLAAAGALAIGCEIKPERAARAHENITRFGLDERIEVRLGDAATLAADLPVPDAVFVGGGATSGVLEKCWRALRPGGRMVVHSVTLEAEALCVELYAYHGGELTRLAVEHAEPIGRFTGWKPARPIVQWAATKPTPMVGPVEALKENP